MAKLINTKYGYVTPQEAEMDAHLDKWMKRRVKKHGAFSLEKNKKVVIIMNKVLLKKLNTEYDELTDKIAKAWPAASNLDIPDEQRQLIGIQARAMETYAQVLAIRIRLLEK
ncbi:crAss001_48 related protein [Lactiplantibacillus plantarum]|uniref:crAss001_48 related protein n=1 Tax=Lactiplantibacillus plantarum TaxID=1590 RepID=UPI0007BB0A60|nr:hypothetical protein [Lactiplantibacillus plantarum]KZU53070.1 hypothetical protein Nizo2801_1908 [Lactiplantibacillus plantarum]